MHLPGTHGVDALVWIGSFPGSISIARSLKVPSSRSSARRFGGGSKVGRFGPSVGLPFASDSAVGGARRLPLLAIHEPQRGREYGFADQGHGEAPRPC
jgi:hypothetical protein